MRIALFFIAATTEAGLHLFERVSQLALLETILSGGISAPALEEWILPLGYALLEIQTSSGTILMAHTNTSGIELPSLWNNTAGHNSFEISGTTSSAPFSDLDKSQFSKFWESLSYPNDSVGREYIFMHGWDTNFLTYPILKESSIIATVTPPPQDPNNSNNNAATEVDSGYDQLIVKGSPLNHKIHVTIQLFTRRLAK